MAVLLGDVFSRRDPPAIATSFSASKLEEVAVVFGAKSAREGLSAIAVSATTGAIIGAVLAHDFGAQIPGEIEKIDLDSEPVIALIDGLEDAFRESHDVVPGKFLHIFMIAVRDDWTGKGIAHELIQSCLNNAGTKGYRLAFTEATNKTSQHIFRKIGFEQKCIAGYEDFEFRGQRPFKSIGDQVGCALMETKIG
ncbi:MAG: GNAT family N-acetyltransferase [Rhodobacteraceae bacterium]|nr:GNAT family N-acetyltransferase [Paracoccaceae bacterium]